MAALASELSVNAATDELLRRSATVDESTLSSVGEDLAAVAGVLAANPAARRLLTESTAPEEGRVRLAERLFSGKVGDLSFALVTFAVARQWSTGRDLVDGLRRLGRTALFLRAERAHELDSVEEELFRFSRILAAHPEIGLVLDNPATSSAARVEIVAALLADKVNPLTKSLLTALAADTEGRSYANGVGVLVEQAAQRRDQMVAMVTSAVTLTAEETARLKAALTTIYGRSVVVHVIVDASMVGGMTIRVGDEVIDGSISGRLRTLKARLAR